MLHTNNFSTNSSSLVYQIRLKGYLHNEWSEWFGDVVIDLEGDGNTLLTTLPIDQAALYGLLKKIRDLGLPLLSLNAEHVDK